MTRLRFSCQPQLVKPRTFFTGLAFILTTNLAFSQSDLDWLKEYRVTWTTPSLNSAGSMPLSGIRGSGANVWVQDGSVWLYLAHADAYDEKSVLRKLGCIRITPESGPLLTDSGFSQELDPAAGTIRIHAHSKVGEFTLSLWFDPAGILHLDYSSQVQIGTSTPQGGPEALKLELGFWTDDFHVEVIPHSDAGPDKWHRDVLCWYHQNDNSKLDSIDQSVLDHGVVKNGWKDIRTDSIFGGGITTSQETQIDPAPEEVTWQSWHGKAWVLHTRIVNYTDIHFAIDLAMDHAPDLAKWKETVDHAVTSAVVGTNEQTASDANQKRWLEYWGRSFVIIKSGSSADDRAWQAGKNYNLFRYMLACNQNGDLPLKFNGGIFTVDPWKGEQPYLKPTTDPSIAPDKDQTPDYRRWDNCYFGQNQRWLGWPGLMSGDSDTVDPSLNFYLRNLPLAQAACEAYEGHAGAIYPEVMLPNGQAWNSDKWRTKLEHLKYHNSMMVEHAWMALEYAKTFGADIKPFLPFIDGVLRYYDEHFRRELKQRTGQELDAKGHLVLYPTNGLELLIGATNPVEVVSGLKRIVDRILSLPPEQVPPETLELCKKMKPTLPNVPGGAGPDGALIVYPAASSEKAFNHWEFP